MARYAVGHEVTKARTRIPGLKPSAFFVSSCFRGCISGGHQGVDASAFFFMLAGASILLFYPSPDEWGFWIALGIVSYGGIVGLFGALSTRRLFRRARQAAII
jgi:hypothetical protein